MNIIYNGRKRTSKNGGVIIKYNVEDTIKHKKYGKGVIKKYTPKDLILTALVEFEDGARVWLAKWQLGKEVTKYDS